MTDYAVVTLRCGSLEAELHPALGARLGRLRRHVDAEAPFDYLIPIEPHGFDLNRWQRAGCFPMLPFANKFRGNRLIWRNANVCVAEADGPAWLHGWGLRSAWQVENVSATHCAMTHAIAASPAWPWAYRAKLDVDLAAHGITLRLVVLNESEEPMPLGTGFHPYFAVSGTARTTVQASAIWRADQDSDGLPARREALGSPLHLELQHAPLPAETFTWFCETDSTAQASIEYPDAGRKVTLTSPEASNLAVHARAGEPFLCLEPCSHLAGTLDPARDVALPRVPVTLSLHLKLD
jgi:aldose 1-epimerase